MTGSNKTIRVVLIGGSGYAGFEVIRILKRHPQAQLVGVFGPPNELGPMEGFYPLLSKQVELAQELFDVRKVAALKADLAMLCVPHKVAMDYVPKLRAEGIRCIDWSADYRLKDRSVYEKWYCPHMDPKGLDEAVYGLPEYFAPQIRQAGLIANPGCYPTCTILPLAPVLRDELIEPEGIIVNAVSGVSGAGRTPSLAFHYPEMNENFRPYGLGGHRHQPEMEEKLSQIVGRQVELLFQPHLAPMDRGMVCSIYARPRANVTAADLTAAMKKAYADKPFVRVREKVVPAAKYVSGTNFCDVYATIYKGRAILFGAIDNLIKGASGQAVQNMNLMFGLDETAGLY